MSTSTKNTKRKKNKILVACPICNVKRELEESYAEKYFEMYGTNPVCRYCAAEKYSTKRIKKSKSDQIKHCGCTMIKTKSPNRCKPMDRCEHYMSCLSRIKDCGWQGWISKQNGAFFDDVE